MQMTPVSTDAGSNLGCSWEKSTRNIMVQAMQHTGQKWDIPQNIGVVLKTLLPNHHPLEGISVAFVPEVPVDFDMFVTRDLLVNLPPMVDAFLGVFASRDLRKQIFEKMLRMIRQRSLTPGNALALL